VAKLIGAVVAVFSSRGDLKIEVELNYSRNFPNVGTKCRRPNSCPEARRLCVVRLGLRLIFLAPAG
jgi:hypothetical protein